MVILNQDPGMSPEQGPGMQVGPTETVAAPQRTFVERAIDLAATVFRILPNTMPSDGMSEHFGHSKERNDPNPQFLTRVR